MVLTININHNMQWNVMGKYHWLTSCFCGASPSPHVLHLKLEVLGLILKVSIQPPYLYRYYIHYIHCISIIYIIYLLYIYYISIIYIYILYLYYICISIYIYIYIYYIYIIYASLYIYIYICVYSVYIYIYIPWRILALPPALAGPALPKPWWWRVHWNKPTWNSISLSPRWHFCFCFWAPKTHNPQQTSRVRLNGQWLKYILMRSASLEDQLQLPCRRSWRVEDHGDEIVPTFQFVHHSNKWYYFNFSFTIVKDIFSNITPITMVKYIEISPLTTGTAPKSCFFSP